jgi:GT2 family glycosyltransferase
VFRLANRALDAREAEAGAYHLPGPAARHAPDVLAGAAAGATLRRASADHLAARGAAAEVETLSDADGARCRVRRRHAVKPGVSIVIPTRDRGDLLAACLNSIFDGAAAARAEILVIDNETRDRKTLDYIAEVGRRGVSVVKAPGPFNFSRLNNLAAERARGEILCFLNNDVEARDEHWLEEMVSRHADPSVGVVGAKLAWPSGVVQHGGVTLGVNFAPCHAFRDRIEDDPGYGGQLLSAHETGAVTAACMTTRRAVFLESGGFDAVRFPINFNDVDYALRVASRGLRIVFTPHARLRHLESASRGRDLASDASARLQRELRSLREIWGEALIEDPSYSPLLALSDPPYAALAWPPRSMAPRRRARPIPRRPPPGF